MLMRIGYFKPVSGHRMFHTPTPTQTKCQIETYFVDYAENAATFESCSSVSIVVFCEPAETEEAVDAQSDKELPKSIISRGIINRLRAPSSACAITTIKGSNKNAFTTRSVANLRWHKASSAKSYAETFYIVESNELFVVLGCTAFPQPQGHEVSVIGLEQQKDGKP
ncbi:MAG: hypothetical protein LQ342_005757 [Letrouitia transgressa]|nr:MAG: hypothetical protein LQ342_005757 [Letrouitia transgressa]